MATKTAKEFAELISEAQPLIDDFLEAHAETREKLPKWVRDRAGGDNGKLWLLGEISDMAEPEDLPGYLALWAIAEMLREEAPNVPT